MMELVSTRRRSLLRSFVRARVAILLLQRGTLHAGDLMSLASIDAWTLKMATIGGSRFYRRDLGLLSCGIVEELRVGREVRYRLTGAGRVEAKRLLRERRILGWS